MNKVQMLEEYLKANDVPELVVKKLNPHSYLTDNFAYLAFRIGNSIGDHLDISIEIVFLEEVAKMFGLVLNTTEHAELHSKSTSEKDLDNLVKGAILFENIKHNKKNYKDVLIRIQQNIRDEFKKVIAE